MSGVLHTRGAHTVSRGMRTRNACCGFDCALWDGEAAEAEPEAEPEAAAAVAEQWQRRPAAHRSCRGVCMMYWTKHDLVASRATGRGHA